MAQKGFTLLEILLVIAAIGVLASIVIIAINPTRQLSQVRDTARKSEINALWKALKQYEVDNQTMPASIMNLAFGTEQEICDGETTEIDCINDGMLYLNDIVPTYLGSIPKDPNAIGNGSGYYVYKSPTGETGISSDHGEFQEITIGRTFQPTDFVDLTLWYDANGEINFENTDQVSNWGDMSGNDRDAIQTDGGEQPRFVENILHGKPALEFDGLNDHLAISNFSHTGVGSIPEMTVTSVLQTFSTQEQIVASFDRNEYWRLSVSDDDPIGMIAFDTNNSSNTHDTNTNTVLEADGQARILTGWYNRTSIPSKVTYLNNQIIGQATPHGTNGLGTSNTRYGFIGVGSEASVLNGATGPNAYLHGYLGEFIYYQRALNENERALLDNYLSRKWGIK